MLEKDIDNLFDRIEACLNDDKTVDFEALRHDLEKWPLGEPDGYYSHCACMCKVLKCKCCCDENDKCHRK